MTSASTLTTVSTTPVIAARLGEMVANERIQAGESL